LAGAIAQSQPKKSNLPSAKALNCWQGKKNWQETAPFTVSRKVGF